MARRIFKLRTNTRNRLTPMTQSNPSAREGGSFTHGSLFSGIGGFDLAASWLNWENVFQCEIDPFCRAVLKKHFPETLRYEDIKKTDFRTHRGTIDVLSGGFPCQPFSVAGQRKGTEDDRNLWPEMLRAIREIQPSWVVGENVHGLINWGNGVVFQQIHVYYEHLQA